MCQETGHPRGAATPPASAAASCCEALPSLRAHCARTQPTSVLLPCWSSCQERPPSTHLPCRLREDLPSSQSDKPGGFREASQGFLPTSPSPHQNTTLPLHTRPCC